MSNDIVKNLVLDNWYKVIIGIASVVLVLALTVPLQVPNVAVLFVAVGALVFGLGQWINHPVQTRVGSGYSITSHNRRPSLGGRFMESLGVVLMCFGGYLIGRAAL